MTDTKNQVKKFLDGKLTSVEHVMTTLTGLGQAAEKQTSVQLLTETAEKMQSVSAEVRDISTGYTFYTLTEKEFQLGKKQIPAMSQPNPRKELGILVFEQTSVQNSFDQHIIQWRTPKANLILYFGELSSKNA